MAKAVNCRSMRKCALIKASHDFDGICSLHTINPLIDSRGHWLKKVVGVDIANRQQSNAFEKDRSVQRIGM